MTLKQELETLAQAAIHAWDLAYRRGEITMQVCREEIARILAAQSAPLV